MLLQLCVGTKNIIVMINETCYFVKFRHARYNYVVVHLPPHATLPLALLPEGDGNLTPSICRKESGVESTNSQHTFNRFS